MIAVFSVLLKDKMSPEYKAEILYDKSVPVNVLKLWIEREAMIPLKQVWLMFIIQVMIKNMYSLHFLKWRKRKDEFEAVTKIQKC